MTLSAANGFALSQPWFTNNQNVCKLCQCHCWFFLTADYFPFVASHSWLIVTIQSGQFSLKSPHVIRVSSTFILNILTDISYTHILLMRVTCGALSLATPKLKDLGISHNLEAQVCFHTLFFPLRDLIFIKRKPRHTNRARAMNSFGSFPVWIWEDYSLLSLRCGA